MVYTLHRHGYTVYLHVCTWFIQVRPFSYHVHAKPFFPWGMPLVLACATLDIGTDYAIIQESRIVYKQGYTLYIPPKNVLARWSAFLWHLFKNEYIHVCQHLYIDIQCTMMSVHEKEKILQESWLGPPGQAILRGYIQGKSLFVHNGWFLHNSIYSSGICIQYMAPMCSVCTCIYTMCTCRCNVHTCFYHNTSCQAPEVSTNMSVHVCTWYIHLYGVQFIHVHTMYVHICTVYIIWWLSTDFQHSCVFSWQTAPVWSVIWKACWQEGGFLEGEAPARSCDLPASQGWWAWWEMKCGYVAVQTCLYYVHKYIFIYERDCTMYIQI
jgi:hypothetical protein